jgi:hypothetical protein
MLVSESMRIWAFRGNKMSSCLRGFGGAVLLVACSRAPAPSAEQSASSAQTATVSAEPVDPTTAQLRAIVEGCQVDVKQGVISACKADERQLLVRQINSGVIDRLAALNVLVGALEGNDPPLQAAAAKILEGTYRSSLGKLGRPGQIPPELSKRLLTAVLKLEGAKATQAVPAAVHAAIVTEQSAMLLKALEEHPNTDVRAAAYVHLLRYGGVQLLPEIERLAQAENPQVAAAAVEALRRMPNQTPTDQTRVCELAQSLAKDKRAPVVAKAVTILATCKGTYLDAAVAVIHSWARSGQLTNTLVRSLDQTCVERKGERYGTSAQCARLRAELEQIAKDKKQDLAARSIALLSIGLQFPDARTRALCKKFTQDPSPRLAAAAERVLTGLDERTPASAASSASKPAKAAPGKPPAAEAAAE